MTGPSALDAKHAQADPLSPRRGSKPVCVVGGSGFIGSNVARSFLEDGEDVIILDNFSRPNVERNRDWLRAEYSDRVRVVVGDIRDPDILRRTFAEARAVFHFAAQTAVTTSLTDPVEDFEVNLRGTFNVLDAVRRLDAPIPVIFASTNKVYGNLEDIALAELDDRYIPEDELIRARGVSEDRPLDFCTPYGCSKGGADQYVLDFAKSYGIPTAVLRMSCIYGPRQFGTEDQGWVAHFLIKALAGEPIAIYGDGKQVRDILHVADAVAAYRLLLDNIGTVSGRAFNLGGGAHNAVSLKRVLAEIARITGSDLDLGYGEWRPGDQLFFVADTTALSATLGWKQTIAWRDGLRDLHAWLTGQSAPNATSRPNQMMRTAR